MSGVQPFGLDQDLGAKRRMRLDRPALGLSSAPGFATMSSGIWVLPTSCSSAASTSAAMSGFVQADLLAEQQAEHRHVDRVAVGQVLVLLDGENLSERSVAAGDLVNQQLNEVADGDDVERLARGGVLHVFCAIINDSA